MGFSSATAGCVVEAAIKPCLSALLGELKFTTCDGGVHMQALEDSRKPRAEGPGI